MFCLPLGTGANLIGLIQWIGVLGGIALLVLHINRGVVTNWTYELPIMFLVAYTLPAFAWFATLFSPESSTKQSYRTIYFCSHFAVEAYAFIVPVVRLHS